MLTNADNVVKTSGSDTLTQTGTHGRKVHRRMRSRFQKGTLQKAGNWVIVRFRIDTPDGQRLLTHEKVCQIVDGKPTLSLAEQRRRAAEIVEAAGVNKTTQIKQNVLGLTFAEQVEKFLKCSRTPQPQPRQHQYRLHMAHHSGQVAASEPWRDVASRCEQQSRRGTRGEDGEGKAGGEEHRFSKADRCFCSR